MGEDFFIFFYSGGKGNKAPIPESNLLMFLMLLNIFSLEKYDKRGDDSEREDEGDEECREDDKWYGEDKFTDDTSHEKHGSKYPRGRHRRRNVGPLEITESEEHGLSGCEFT